MSKSTPEDDVNDLIEDCDTIIELLKKKRTELGRWSIGGESWPEINLTNDDISFLTSTLDANGKTVAKIRIFADKLGNEFPRLAQQIVDAHARVFYTATAMEQGRIHQTDYGKIWNQIDPLKQSLLNFESHYRIQKSYSSVKYDYDKITTGSSGRIHWGKLGVILAIIGIVVTVVVGYYFYAIQNEHNQHLINRTEQLSKTGNPTITMVKIENVNVTGRIANVKIGAQWEQGNSFTSMKTSWGDSMPITSNLGGDWPFSTNEITNNGISSSWYVAKHLYQFNQDYLFTIEFNLTNGQSFSDSANIHTQEYPSPPPLVVNQMIINYRSIHTSSMPNGYVVSVFVFDQFDDRLPNATVYLSTDAGVLSSTNAVTDSNGIASVNIASPATESRIWANLTARAGDIKQISQILFNP